MENDQQDPQGPNSLNDQQRKQPSTDITYNSNSTTTGSSGEVDNKDAESRETGRNYSEESSDVKSRENEDSNNSPANNTVTRSDIDRTSKIPMDDDSDWSEKETEEFKEIPHPHRRKIPESDDDFKHDM